jgi:hypothetical protein
MYKLRQCNKWKPIFKKDFLKGQAPEAVINSYPGAALPEYGGRMAVDNCSHRENTNGNMGSILNADGTANPVTVLSSGNRGLQLWGKWTCNFGEKRFAILGKNVLQKTLH